MVKRAAIGAALLVTLSCADPPAASPPASTPSEAQATVESVCYGTVSNGRLRDGVKLPDHGPNFTAYSSLGQGLGRTYVHSKVRDVVVAAYAALETTAPGKAFVYGETGWATGGRIRPHRTHQNGLSVDFFVPVRDRSGRSVPVPTTVSNRFGYDLEFDEEGRVDEYTIDFDAMAEHLFQLRKAAEERGVGIALVIVDAPYRAKLSATARGPFLDRSLPFMKGKPWIRHDEHYHVDFDVPCRPIEEKR